MTDIERDLDYIIMKTQQLFTIVEQEDYHLLETKELIRQQLIEQFFINYSADDITIVANKFDTLVSLSANLTKQCENILAQTKHDILKIKKVEKIKKAYKK